MRAVATELVTIARSLLADAWRKRRHTWSMEDGEYRAILRPSFDAVSRGKIVGYGAFILKGSLEIDRSGSQSMSLRDAKKWAERELDDRAKTITASYPAKFVDGRGRRVPSSKSGIIKALRGPTSMVQTDDERAALIYDENNEEWDLNVDDGRYTDKFHSEREAVAEFLNAVADLD
jgi:hypothetical protein